MKKIICIIIAAALLCCCVTASAEADKAVFTLSSEKTSLKPGDEFTVTIGINNQYEIGVCAFDFQLYFDNQCFEYIDSTLLNGTDEMDFTVLQPNKTKGLITSVLLELTPLDESVKEICQLKFKVLDKAAGGNTKIYFEGGSLATMEYDDDPSSTTKAPKVVDITGEKFGELTLNVVSDFTRPSTAPVVQGGTIVEYVPVTQKVTDSKGQVVTNAAGQPQTEKVTNDKGEQITSVIYKTVATDSVLNNGQNNQNNSDKMGIPVLVWVAIAIAVAAVVIYIIFMVNKKN